MGGFNETWSLGVVAQNIPQLPDDNFENAIANKGSWPDGLEKLVFCDQLARTPKQVIQHCEGFRSESDGLRAIPQAFVGQVQEKAVEGDSFFVGHGAPALPKFYGRIMTLNACGTIVPS